MSSGQRALVPAIVTFFQKERKIRKSTTTGTLFLTIRAEDAGNQAGLAGNGGETNERTVGQTHLAAGESSQVHRLEDGRHAVGAVGAGGADLVRGAAGQSEHVPKQETIINKKPQKRKQRGTYQANSEQNMFWLVVLSSSRMIFPIWVTVWRVVFCCVKYVGFR